MTQRTLRAHHLSESLLSHLERVSSRRSTGRLRIRLKGESREAMAYVVDGALYALHLENYFPPILSRLLASELVDESHVQTLANASAGDVTRAGVVAMNEGWISPAVLSALHHEYLLGSLAAVALAGDMDIEERSGESTAQFCAAPIEVTAALEATTVRLDKMALDVSAIRSHLGSKAKKFDPATTILVDTGIPFPGMNVPSEFIWLRNQLGSGVSLDAAAYRAGYTRAEGLHIVAEMSAAGIVSVRDSKGMVSKTHELLVPEAFPGSSKKGGLRSRE